jgi:lipoate-protein ligase A
MAVFGKLTLWLDTRQRPGPEAMAVDEWLVETTKVPVLRVYGWQGNWGSLGYFGKISEARAALTGLDWVRRWTGGGLVDHRSDWTYTLAAPVGEKICRLRGAESYRLIHAALAMALEAEGIDARLSSGKQQTGAALCFSNPVGHDLVDGAGRKLAGAGQRRTKSGLLHQGSLALACGQPASAQRAGRLAAALAEQWEHTELEPPVDLIERKVRDRYASAAWTARC